MPSCQQHGCSVHVPRVFVAKAPAWLSDASIFMLADALHSDLTLRLRGAPGAKPVPHDLLAEPRVCAFLALAVPTSRGCEGRRASSVPSSWVAPSTFPELTIHTAPSIAAVFYFAALSRTLPPLYTRGLLMEVSALFLSLMRSLQTTLRIRSGVQLVAFLQFVVACVVQLRRDEAPLRCGTTEIGAEDVVRAASVSSSTAATTAAAAVLGKGNNNNSNGSSSDVGHASMDKVVIDDALAHALPSQRAPSQWSVLQANAVVAIVTGLRAGAAAVHRRGHSFRITSALWMELLTMVETLVDRHQDVVSQQGSNDGDAPPATSVLGVRLLSEWPPSDLTVVTELVAICGLVDVALPTRVLRVLAQLTTTRLLVDALQSAAPHAARLLCMSSLLLHRFRAVASPPRSPSTPSPSPPRRPSSTNGADDKQDDPSVAVPQAWLAVLSDLEGSLASSSVRKNSSSGNADGQRPVQAATTTPADATTMQHGAVNGTAVVLLVRVVLLMHREAMMADLHDSIWGGGGGGGNSRRRCALPCHIADVITGLMDVEAADDGLEMLAVLTATTTTASFYSPPPNDNYSTATLLGEDARRRGGYNGTASASPPRAPSQHTLYELQAAIHRIAAMMQDVLRLVVSPRGGLAMLRTTAAATSPSAVAAAFVSLAPHGLLGEQRSRFVAEAETLLLNDIRALLDAVQSTLATISGFRIDTSALGQSLTAMATELLHRCVAQISAAPTPRGDGGGMLRRASTTTTEPPHSNANSRSPSGPPQAVERRSSNAQMAAAGHPKLSTNHLLTTPQSAEGSGDAMGDCLDSTDIMGRSGSDDASCGGTIDVGASTAVIRALCTAFPFIQKQLADELLDIFATRKATTVRTTGGAAFAAGGGGVSPTTSPSPRPVDLPIPFHTQEQQHLGNGYDSEWATVLQGFCVSLLTKIALDQAQMPSLILSDGPRIPQSIDLAAFSLVLRLLSEQVCDAVREEVRSGRILPSAATTMHSAAHAAPMYISATLETLVHSFSDLASCAERRITCMVRLVDEACLRPLDAHNRRPPPNGSDSTSSGGMAMPSASWMASVGQFFESEAAAIDLFVATIVKLAVSLGWPGSGILFQNHRSDAQSFSSVGVVFQTILAPFIGLLAGLQQWSLVAARCAGLMVQLESQGARCVDHICAWWPKWAFFDASCVPPGVVVPPAEHYRLCEVTASPAWTSAIIEKQVTRLRSLWLLLAMHGITTSTVESIAHRLGLSKGKKGNALGVDSTASEPGATSSKPLTALSGSGHERCMPGQAMGGGSGSGTHLQAFAESTHCALAAIHHSGESGALQYIAVQLVRLAVASPPLVHLKSAECQQTFAEIASFERQLGAKSAQEFVRNTQAAISKLCPPVAAYVNRGTMAFAEVALLRTILDVAALRARAGSIHVVVQYAQVELREFVSTKELTEAIPLCLSWVMGVYLATLGRQHMPVARAASLFVHDATVLIYLSAVGTTAVRSQATAMLHTMFASMPHMCAEPPVLSALLHTLNVIQTGDEEELASFCDGLHVRHVSQTSSEQFGSERQAIHAALFAAANEWLHHCKLSTPHRLFDSAVRFLLDHEDENNILGMSHYSGSELAIRVCLGGDPSMPVGAVHGAASTQQPLYGAGVDSGNGNGGTGVAGGHRTQLWSDAYSGLISRDARPGILVLASSRLRNYASTMMKRNRAAGSIEGALRFAPMDRVEREAFLSLQSCVRQMLATLSECPELSERLLVKLAGQRSTASSYSRQQYHRSPFSILDGSNPGVVSFVSSTASANNCGGGSPNNDAAIANTIELFVAIANGAALINTGHMTRAVFSATMKYLVQGPVQLFSASVLHLAIGSWKWILAGRLRSSIEDTRILLSNLCSAVEWSVTQRLGLFDGAPDAQLLRVESGCSEREALVRLSPLHPESRSATGDNPPPPLYAADYSSNSPHKILLAFLAEHFADRRLPIANDPVVLRLLFRLVVVWTREPEQLSLKDASFGEYLRGTLFCLHVIESVHIANTQRMSHAKQLQQPQQQQPLSALLVPFGALITARSRTYDCLLRWFSKHPPSFYMTQDTHNAVLNESYVLEELIDAIGREQDRLSVSQRGFLPSERVDLVEAMSIPSTGVLRRRAHPGPPSDTSSGPSARTTGKGKTKPDAKSGAGIPVTEAFKALHNTLGLLRFLLKHEAHRLLLWMHPRRAQQPSAQAAFAPPDATPQLWKAYCETADTAMPDVLIGLFLRFPSNPSVQRYASTAITNNPAAYAHIAAAVDLYLHQGTLHSGAEHLHLWTNCSIIQALRLLDEPFQAYPHVVRYAIRSLLSTDSKDLIFYLPQLLQCFAHDRSNAIESFFRAMCKRSVEFTHQLLWCFQTEGEGSGVLAAKCTALSDSIRAEMTHAQLTFYENEFHYVGGLIALSGALKPVEKPKRKERLRELLRTDAVAYHDPIPLQHLYLPTNPDLRIVKLIPGTAGAMQSAAKCPILVQFEVEVRDPEHIALPMAASRHGHQQPHHDGLQQPLTTAIFKRACIFKMGDDCRQDQIALQLIAFIKRIVSSVNLPCFLFPYRVVTTGQSSGIIECVPNAMSRDQIGKLVESNLAEYFVQTYGPPQTPAFRKARMRFVQSMASYSVASYILNIKDRHNGNIMLDDQGHLIHIDFGFIFDFSPGGDMNFESSPFKLTQEMLQLMGDAVSGSNTVSSPELAQLLIDPETYETFVRLTVLCYLAVRQYGQQICVLVELMLPSGLPCFKPKKTIADLVDRLSLNRSEEEAAAFMFARVAESRDNMRTRLYDRYQHIAEGIEM